MSWFKRAKWVARQKLRFLRWLSPAWRRCWRLEKDRKRLTDAWLRGQYGANKAARGYTMKEVMAQGVVYVPYVRAVVSRTLPMDLESRTSRALRGIQQLKEGGGPWLEEEAPRGL